jgi:crossover junction endodeoxyribonuclease RuvC
LADKDKIILGVDPGTTVMGYGIILVRKQQYKLLAMGIIQLHKFTKHYDKLNAIYNKTTQLINNYNPAEMAIEAPFYGKNVQSMLKLGRAQGTCIIAAMQKGIPVFEYAPKKIKQSVTGNGNASKEQVAGMLAYLIEFDRKPKFHDATDALATAICHDIQSGKNSLGNAPSYKSWSDFLKQNPEQIK